MGLTHSARKPPTRTEPSGIQCRGAPHRANAPRPAHRRQLARLGRPARRRRAEPVPLPRRRAQGVPPGVGARGPAVVERRAGRPVQRSRGGLPLRRDPPGLGRPGPGRAGGAGRPEARHRSRPRPAALRRARRPRPRRPRRRSQQAARADPARLPPLRRRPGRPDPSPPARAERAGPAAQPGLQQEHPGGRPLDPGPSGAARRHAAGLGRGASGRCGRAGHRHDRLPRRRAVPHLRQGPHGAPAARDAVPHHRLAGQRPGAPGHLRGAARDGCPARLRVLGRLRRRGQDDRERTGDRRLHRPDHRSRRRQRGPRQGRPPGAAAAGPPGRHRHRRG